MRVRFSIYIVVVLVASEILAMGQESKTTVKHETAPLTSPASGKDMFENYCASCHGKGAKGDGPAASALKQAPADLTTLAKRNGGKYPDDKVNAILRGEAKLMAHGDQEMPVWGPVFWKMSGGREEVVQLRVSNLNKYLESLQQK